MIESDYGAALTAAKKCTPGRRQPVSGAGQQLPLLPGLQAVRERHDGVERDSNGVGRPELRLDAARLPCHRLPRADGQRLRQRQQYDRRSQLRRRSHGACTNAAHAGQLRSRHAFEHRDRDAAPGCLVRIRHVDRQRRRQRRFPGDRRRHRERWQSRRRWPSRRSELRPDPGRPTKRRSPPLDNARWTARISARRRPRVRSAVPAVRPSSTTTRDFRNTTTPGTRPAADQNQALPRHCLPRAQGGDVQGHRRRRRDLRRFSDRYAGELNELGALPRWAPASQAGLRPGEGYGAGASAAGASPPSSQIPAPQNGVWVQVGSVETDSVQAVSAQRFLRSFS